MYSEVWQLFSRLSIKELPEHKKCVSTLSNSRLPFYHIHFVMNFYHWVKQMAGKIKILQNWQNSCFLEDGFWMSNIPHVNYQILASINIQDSYLTKHTSYHVVIANSYKILACPIRQYTGRL